jgi:hypothetical protein
MSLLGKIFTVCILLASFFLMIVAMFVYATHKNWSEEHSALSQKFREAQTANQALEAKYTEQIAQLQAEKDAALQDVSKLESELDTVSRQNAVTQQEVDELRAQRREVVGLVTATENNNESLMTEVLGLRSSIAENQQARDDAFQKTLQATNELHTTSLQFQALKERSAQLVQQLSEAIARMREGGMDPNGEIVVQARGKVTGSRRADGRQLVEISLGYDDGIRPGQKIEIFRGDRYLGRAEILRADPDVAVGSVMREYQVGQIQEQDDVSTKLRVE